MHRAVSSPHFESSITVVVLCFFFADVADPVVLPLDGFDHHAVHPRSTHGRRKHVRYEAKLLLLLLVVLLLFSQYVVSAIRSFTFSSNNTSSEVIAPY